MKKILLSSLLVFACFFKNNAQSIQLLDTTGASGGQGSVAQPTKTYMVDTSALYDVMFNVKNTTSSAITVKLKKYLISNLGGDNITFCIGVNCYGSGTTLSAPVTISANSLMTNGGLLTDFTASNSPNTAKVIYTIFNTANPNDSASVVLNYDVTAATGIKQNAGNYSISNIAPNPASSYASVTHDLNNNQPASIKIYNMLGALVKTVPLETYTNNTKIDINSLEEGIYIYSVNVGGKAVKTSRLVVSR